MQPLLKKVLDPLVRNLAEIIILVCEQKGQSGMVIMLAQKLSDTV